MAHNSETLRQAFHYFFTREMPLLKSIPYLVHQSPVIVINIGAGSGTSGLAFIETRDDLELHTVDIEDKDSPFGSLYSEKHEFMNSGYGHLMGVRWFQHHKDSKLLAKYWEGPVDVVLVDGDHSYEGCKGDILGWMPHIRSGGYIMVHDYAKEGLTFDETSPHPKPWPGVDQAVNEILIPDYEVMAHQDSLIVFKVE